MTCMSVAQVKAEGGQWVETETRKWKSRRWTSWGGDEDKTSGQADLSGKVATMSLKIEQPNAMKSEITEQGATLPYSHLAMYLSS